MFNQLANASRFGKRSLTSIAFKADEPFAKVHGETVWDVKEAELPVLDQACMVQLPSKEFKNFRDGMRDIILRGQGVEIQRESRVQDLWINRVGRWTPEQKAEFFLKQLGWFKRPVGETIPLILQWEHFKNPNLVRITHESDSGKTIQKGGMDGETQLELFPINLHGAEHYKLWTRIPVNHPLALSPRENETKPYFKNTAMELIEFVQNHDMFGTNMPEEDFRGITLGEKLRAPPGYGQHSEFSQVPLDEGVRAMLWVGRFITEAIEKEFPGKTFGWFHVNKHYRSFHAPTEIHIVFPKEA